MKRNDGFTLVELLVSLTAGALVTFAAVTLLLMGTRIQHGSATDVQEQQTVRVVLSLLEKMAGSGEIRKIENTYDGWQLLDSKEEGAKVLFEYVQAEQTVYTGSALTGSPLLTGLHDADVTLEGSEHLLRLAFETSRGESYETRVYCRAAAIADDKDYANSDVEGVLSDIAGKKPEVGTLLDSPAGRRLAFLEALAQEYKGGANYGEVQNPISDEDYYSQWYIGTGWEKNGWNKDTPWCACFVSWAAVKSGIIPRDDAGKDFVFANVDEGMALFRDEAMKGEWKDGSETPTPGDYIFFDWSGQRKDPAHVGVVLDVKGEDIYTIEGNSSNRVAVRRYSLDDPAIMGYGVLPQFLSAGEGA